MKIVPNWLKNYIRSFDRCPTEGCNHWRRYHVDGACGRVDRNWNACSFGGKYVISTPLEAIHEFGEKPRKVRPNPMAESPKASA